MRAHIRLQTCGGGVLQDDVTNDYSGLLCDQFGAECTWEGASVRHSSRELDATLHHGERLSSSDRLVHRFYSRHLTPITHHLA